MTKTKLKPCPFCGEREILVDTDVAVSICVCYECGAEGPFSDCEEGAIAAWNRRSK